MRLKISNAIFALLLACSLSSAKVFLFALGQSTLTYRLVYPLGAVRGVNNHFLCEAELPGDPPGDLSKIKIHAAAEWTGFNSGDSSRDALIARMLESSKYPMIAFEGSTEAREGNAYRIAGTLHLHGCDKAISFLVFPRKNRRKFSLSGSFRIKLSDYNVLDTGLLCAPKDEMEVELNAVAYPES